MDDEPLAQDKLEYIQRVIDYLGTESASETLSWHEVSVIDSLYETAKTIGEEDI